MSAMQNLTAFVNNDTTFQMQVTQYGSPLNLTPYTLKLYVKATPQALDSTATVYTAGSGLTMIQVRGGLFNFVLPHANAAAAGTFWWRVDIVDTFLNTGTALYGYLYIVAA
jgi:hypothetical protein